MDKKQPDALTILQAARRELTVNGAQFTFAWFVLCNAINHVIGMNSVHHEHAPDIPLRGYDFDIVQK